MYPSSAVSMPLSIRPARVGCSQTNLVAKEFSQHRHRSFRIVIASLPAHTHRLRANRQRQATRRLQETTQATDARCVCVCIRPRLCLCLCLSVLRALVGCKKLCLKKSFRSIVIVVTPPAPTHTGCGPTDKEKLRGACRRQHKRQTRGVCVCIRPRPCLCLCLSVLLALVARKTIWLQKSFCSIVIVNHAADRKLQRETKHH